MKKSILASLLVIGVLLFGVTAQASYVLFDDISTSSGAGFVNIPANYQGYQWTGFGVVSQGAYNALLSTSVSTNISFPSQPNAAYNGDNANASVTITSATPFVFNGAEFWAWAPGATATTKGASAGGYTPNYLTVSGWLKGVQVGSDQLIDFWDNLKGFGGQPHAYLDGLAWTVDTVKFALDTTVNSSNAGYWSMDCVNVAATPVPPSLYLLAAGIVGTLVARRRSKVKI
jgi:hypothetical protein